MTTFKTYRKTSGGMRTVVRIYRLSRPTASAGYTITLDGVGFGHAKTEAEAQDLAKKVLALEHERKRYDAFIVKSRELMNALEGLRGKAGHSISTDPNTYTGTEDVAKVPEAMAREIIQDRIAWAKYPHIVAAMARDVAAYDGTGTRSYVIAWRKP